MKPTAGVAAIARWVGCAILANLIVAGVASAANSRLTGLAVARFSHLTRAERALLEWADARNIARGPYLVSGPSADFNDPSNDPKAADKWDHSRDIRALLLRWLFVDPEAARLVDPSGIRILGARIVGGLDLSSLQLPYGLTCDRCAIAEPIDLRGAEIPDLDLDGTYTTDVNASGVKVRTNVNMGRGFHGMGTTYLDHANVGLDLNCEGGNFRYVKHDGGQDVDSLRDALFAYVIHVGANIILSDGFVSDGSVMIGGATIGGDLNFAGGRFFNPNRIAIFAAGISIDGVVYLGAADTKAPIENSGVDINGLAWFLLDQVRNSFIVNGARFLGSTGEAHGFNGSGMKVQNAFVWQHVTLSNGATLDLSGAKVGALLDQEDSWPAPGKLFIDGFNYGALGIESPQDVASRLRWINLQANGFHAPAYAQLAATYRNAGMDRQATEVSIAEEDARYSTYGLPGKVVGAFLKGTVGYGHLPFRTILWMAGVILCGWGVVAIAKRAGLMRLTWPETSQPPEGESTARLHPLLYSLDVFLPFVNLHQEHYWWPDSLVTGDLLIFSRRFAVRGSVVQYYLWVQIIAGWLLSAIFVAGVTGLMRND